MYKKAHIKTKFKHQQNPGTMDVFLFKEMGLIN